MRRWMGVLALALLLGGCATGKAPEEGKLIDPPPAVACGTEEQRHRTGIDEEARKCILTNFASGTPARFVTSILTEEGDPIFYTVRVMAKESVEVDVDTTKDKFGEQKVTHYVCKTLANRILPNERHYQVLEATGCKGGPNTEITF